MRILLPFLCAITLGAPIGRCQDYTFEPLPDKPEAEGAATGAEAPDPLEQPLQLIPQEESAAAPDYGDPAQLAADAAALRERLRQPTETQISANAHKQKVGMRQARIKAAKDPAVIEAWDQAESAHTDAERRYALRLYYNRLYDRMLKINGGLSAPIEEQRSEALGELKQDRIRPSVWGPENGR